MLLRRIAIPIASTVFQCIAGYRAIAPPPLGGYRKIMLRGGGVRGGLGGLSQLKPALCAIGRFWGGIAAILSQITVGWPTKGLRPWRNKAEKFAGKIRARIR